MSGPSKNTTTYSASDLQRYLRGEMSAREMHDLEVAALEDPFLADALEGFEKQGAFAPTTAHTGDETLSGHLDDLRARLDRRVTNSEKRAPGSALKVFSLRAPWLRIAAAAILLIGLSAGAWYGLLNKKQAPDLVAKHNEPAVSPAPSATMDSTKIAPAPLAAADSTIMVAPPTPKSAHVPPASLARTAKKTAAPPSPADSIPLIASDQANYTPQAKSLYKDTTAYNFHPLVFSGKVLDVHNNPLPGATLSLAGPSGNNAIGTVTDRNGYFSMNVYPKDSVLKVTVGMVGYQQTSLAFKTLNTEASTGNLIHLAQRPDPLGEVVVSGFGSKRKETRALASSPDDENIDSLWINAKPVMGEQAYLDYLAAGKKTIAADSSIKGTVIISFDVSKKGELTSFKVEQSLTPAHDAGVIHLISEGPPWKKVSKGRSVRTAVRVVF